MQRIKPLARGTHRKGVVGGIGGFGGLLSLKEVGFLWLTQLVFEGTSRTILPKIHTRY